MTVADSRQARIEAHSEKQKCIIYCLITLKIQVKIDLPHYARFYFGLEIVVIRCLSDISMIYL